jgi:hypothetical protein
MGRRTREIAVLVLLWAAVTGPFLGKAFHIDDTVHVLQAEHIAANPTRPLDLEIFWFEWPERLADSNPVTPPVWQYELAGAVALAGGAKEVVLNSLAAVHLLVLVLSVYFLAGWVIDRPMVAASLVLVSPAAVVGRNVMLDIPMMSYLVSGLAVAVYGSERGRTGLFALGALLVGISSVTKLPGLVGVPALAGYMIFARRPRQLFTLAVALVPLCLWYLYQLSATGGIDIMRPRGGGGFVPEHSIGTSLRVAADHAVFWGGAILTGHLFLACLLLRWAVWPLALLPLAALAIANLAQFETGEPGQILLGVAFLAGGGGLALGTVAGGRRLWREGGVRRRLAGLLGLWCLGHVGFAVVGLWEMNVRFAFLSALPATLLCLAEVEWLESRTGVRWRATLARSAGLLLAGIVSLSLAWQDSEWADGYRRIARSIAAAHPNEKIWFVGHWGFQHYATASGLVPYSPRDDEITAGDLLVVPLNAARQSVPESVMEDLNVLERQAISPVLPVRTMTGGGGFYSTGWGPLPWGWSRDAADIVVVTRYEP